MSVRKLPCCVLGAVWCVILGLVLPLPGRAQSQDGTLRSGTARVDITPKVPVALAGYAGRKGLSQGVHDRLFGALSRSSKEGIGSSSLRPTCLASTARRTRRSARRLSRHATSNPRNCSSRPRIRTAARAWALTESAGCRATSPTRRILAPRWRRLSRRRLGTPRPCVSVFGSGSSPVGVNRRQPVTDRSGKTRIVLGRNPGALTDREVQVLAVRPVDASRPATLLFAYPTHSTSLGPGNLLLSGDVHGLAAQFVEAHLGHGLTAAALAGASGDIDPGFAFCQGSRPRPAGFPSRSCSARCSARRS